MSLQRQIQFLSTPSARRATGRYLHAGPPDKISIHALCEEGDEVLLGAVAEQVQFLSTPSARRATQHSNDDGVDRREFLSTPSARRATPTATASSSTRENFYPRPLRGGRRHPLGGGQQVDKISIHALCEEGDLGFFCHICAS